MCHSSFEWKPNNCVNFITGSNGSGKSSILQGLYRNIYNTMAVNPRNTECTKILDGAEVLNLGHSLHNTP